MVNEQHNSEGKRRAYRIIPLRECVDSDSFITFDSNEANMYRRERNFVVEDVLEDRLNLEVNDKPSLLMRAIAHILRIK